MDHFTLELEDIADLAHEVAISGAIRTGMQGGDTFEHIVAIIDVINGG